MIDGAVWPHRKPFQSQQQTKHGNPHILFGDLHENWGSPSFASIPWDPHLFMGIGGSGSVSPERLIVSYQHELEEQTVDYTEGGIFDLTVN